MLKLYSSLGCNSASLICSVLDFGCACSAVLTLGSGLGTKNTNKAAFCPDRSSKTSAMSIHGVSSVFIQSKLSVADVFTACHIGPSTSRLSLHLQVAALAQR